ncbi:hypothetical protein TWF506_004381 [Arthrobotrys conoides]|uniref:Uncharacterized protein n=1 Tax=Arthrobotrys conoides TaxID=74498 RepID=A0AAN8RPI0_9PEZI
MDSSIQYPEASTSPVGPRSTVNELVDKYGRGERSKPLETEHPDLKNTLNSLAEPFDLADKSKTNQIIHTWHKNQIENHRMLGAAADNHDKNYQSLTYNKNARMETSGLRPITRTRSSDAAVVYELPRYFPKTVREFLTMEAQDIVYLLDFYSIRVMKPLQLPSGLSDTTQSTEVENSIKYIRRKSQS